MALQSWQTPPVPSKPQYNLKIRIRITNYTTRPGPCQPRVWIGGGALPAALRRGLARIGPRADSRRRSQWRKKRTLLGLPCECAAEQELARFDREHRPSRLAAQELDATTLRDGFSTLKHVLGDGH